MLVLICRSWLACGYRRAFVALGHVQMTIHVLCHYNTRTHSFEVCGCLCASSQVSLPAHAAACLILVSCQSACSHFGARGGMHLLQSSAGSSDVEANSHSASVCMSLFGVSAVVFTFLWCVGEGEHCAPR